MSLLHLLAQAAPEAVGPSTSLRVVVAGLFLMNLLAIIAIFASQNAKRNPIVRNAPKFITYELLLFGALLMVIPFYWMFVTAFKDSNTATAIPPVWTPTRIDTFVVPPEGGEPISVVPLTIQRRAEEKVQVVLQEDFVFLPSVKDGYRVVKETAVPERIFEADPATFTTSPAWSFDLKNFRRAWYRPEESSRGQVNFFTYFMVSILTSLAATIGTLFSSALAAFAFARLNFWAKDIIFYILLATMMVPGQVLLIPNFLILSGLGWLDTYAALVVPWLASVFTIFLMRQFFMTIPEDLWDAARIDGASRFRYLWQVVVPLSKPVFITAGIFDFLNNWNSLLWPLIVTSTPAKRTLMVGLQNLSDDAGTEYHIMMAASTMAVMPVVLVFFFLQRFFIEGIARTGLK